MIFQEKEIIRVENEEKKSLNDVVITEIPFTINLNQKEIVTLLSTPQYLEDLAIGFLFSEGLIKGKEQVTIDQEKYIAFVEGKESMLLKETFLKRYITTGCGKGTSFYHFNDAQSKAIQSDVQVESSKITELMKEVQKRSELYLLTGCVHIAALCTEDEIVVFREDLGRHNAVDKIVGYCLKMDIPLQDKFLFTSGRLSSEIILKTARLGVPLLVSRSAPSSLAIELADKLGLTLIGFVRGKRMNIYTHPERIV